MSNGGAARTLVLGVTCAAAVAFAPPVAEAQQTIIRLSPGQSRIVTFVENPSTGYTWAIDRAASDGLGVVAVIDHGRYGGGNLPGAPGERRWTLRALAPGRADIAFVYRRPWEPAPVETRRVVVDVAR